MDAAKESPPVGSQLVKALFKAQLLINPIVQDAFNEYSKYHYVKGETIYIVASRALLKAGLIARRRSWSIDQNFLHQKIDDKGVLESEARMVRMVFQLSHPESGESEIDKVEFPAQVKKGTPLDKAVAAALTTSLAYWLRDLLLIPRVDHEMDKRDDEPAEPGTLPREEALKALKKKLQDLGCKDPADANAVVRFVAIDDRNGEPIYDGIKDVAEKNVPRNCARLNLMIYFG